MKIGYCTNIHSGADFDGVIANLSQFAKPIKQQFCNSHPMGLGLWLSADAARQALTNNRLDRLGQLQTWLEVEGLVPQTFNAFPHSNFHSPVVKHRVYEPHWAESARLEYTLDIIEVIHQLLPATMTGSISTLPLGWPSKDKGADFYEQSAIQLKRVAQRLADIEASSGRRLTICIEPEPGCCLQTSHDVVKFFEDYLFSGESAVQQRNRRYLGVCHDIRHAAVMFEKQQQVLENYQIAGINIGKVQISSAIETSFDKHRQGPAGELVVQIGEFAEPRYLHQTTWAAPDGVYHFFEDLPPALQSMRSQPCGVFRTHFHVPIHLQRIKELGTTQEEIHEFIRAFVKSGAQTHFEIETYAWNVSPESLKGGGLVDSVVRELQWLYQTQPEIEQCFLTT